MHVHDVSREEAGALKAWLAAAETGWSEQLAAFTTHGERG